MTLPFRVWAAAADDVVFYGPCWCDVSGGNGKGGVRIVAPGRIISLFVLGLLLLAGFWTTFFPLTVFSRGLPRFGSPSQYACSRVRRSKSSNGLRIWDSWRIHVRR